VRAGERPTERDPRYHRKRRRDFGRCFRSTSHKRRRQPRANLTVSARSRHAAETASTRKRLLHSAPHMFYRSLIVVVAFACSLSACKRGLSRVEGEDAGKSDAPMGQGGQGGERFDAAATNTDAGTVGCGAIGQACCTGEKCNSDAICALGTCAPCGQPGTLCCAGGRCGDAKSCSAAGTCGDCGGAGQTCCAGSACAAGNLCGSDGKCGACGGAMEPCCTGSVCGGGLGCAAGTCAQCGGPGQPCCGTACQSGATCSSDSSNCNCTASA